MSQFNLNLNEKSWGTIFRYLFSLTTVGAHQMEEIENESKQEERVVDAEITECPLGTKHYMSDIFKTSIII